MPVTLAPSPYAHENTVTPPAQEVSLNTRIAQVWVPTPRGQLTSRRSRSSTCLLKERSRSVTVRARIDFCGVEAARWRQLRDRSAIATQLRIARSLGGSRPNEWR